MNFSIYAGSIFAEFYIHYTRGRMRIQTPFLHENPAKAKELEDFLKKVSGIVSVETNPVTGSALFYFDEKKINCEQIICMLEKTIIFVSSRQRRTIKSLKKQPRRSWDLPRRSLSIPSGRDQLRVNEVLLVDDK